MFSIALYKKLKANFTTSQGKAITWGFGSVTENTQVPYIVFYELDDNRDQQYLCDEHGDSGDYLIQCNIYSNKFGFNNVIKKELGDYIQTLNGTELTEGSESYTIDIIRHSASPSADTLINDLAVDVLAKTINYSKK